MIPLNKRIRIEMLKRDITGAEIARRLGVDRTAIYKTIDGTCRSMRLRRAICEATGLPWSIWDEMDREINRKKEAA